uniref:Cysteine-rich membrane protein 1 n=1 Tax=Spironucleus salmonicida TaxID=348837 RepID=V6LF11_9EUKA|eukprot:EST42858.1 Cysteine-rich membrane protein 1 [Spironucleus salmonicida]
MNQICDNICKDCTGSCATCKEAVDKCTTCKSGFILAGDKCEACPKDCANCDDDKAICKLCNDNFFTEDNTCTKCDGNTTKQCKCGEAVNCATCEASNKEKCETCITGYKNGIDDTCSTCNDGYLMVKMICTKCESNCATCHESLEKCDTCANSYTMSINQTCEKNCSTALVNGNACIGTDSSACGSKGQITECKCANAKNCLICNDSNTTCGSCLPGYKFESDKCEKCEDGYSKTGDFCFIPRKEAGNLSGGAVTGIVISVLVVVGAVGGGLAYYFIKKGKK